ncbi:MAG: carbohydrate porin [Bacteroidota bacterium]
MRYLIILLLLPTLLLAQDQADSIQKFGYSFQQTLVGQVAAADSGYTGYNTNNTTGNTFRDQTMKTSLSSTFYLGAKLWKGGSLYLDPEVAGGSGLSGTVGVAGYVNGEVFRVGNPAPTLYIARLFFRQSLSLSKEQQYISPSANQLGELVATKRLVFTLGKITLSDMFDGNHYSHDPRTRFLNWSMMASGAWDYSSNTKGYTYAFVTEYISPTWSARAGIAMEPIYSNGPLDNHRFLDLEGNINNQGYGLNAELEKPFHFHNQKHSILRILGFVNHANMGTYKNAVHTAIDDTTYIYNASQSLTNTRRFNTVKYGFSVNLEQPVGKHAGFFSRFSWNDGKTESFSFAEIDHSLSMGLYVHGTAWDRYHDKVGIGFAINGISQDHREYLAQGGYGFMLGDGKLNYGNELVIELQYAIDIGQNFIVTPDYQFILNPAYNKDHGSIHIFGVRTHIEF